ncbi:MAG TPA: nitroreductase family protein [Aggregatilineales bacterium]|nr:nitroreductase family protein [Aggregatilineales bacterium]
MICTVEARVTMDVLEAIRTRRSLRRYTAQPVDDALLTALLDAAIRAPSAHNRQPWRFAVVGEAAARERLARAMGERLRADLRADGVDYALIEADAGRSYARLTGAAALIVVCLTMVDMDTYPDAARQAREQHMAVQSVAMAGQNLLLAAHAHGLGACWMCAPLFCPEVVRAALDLPPDWEPQGVITLGYPAETREKTRQPLESVVLWR